MIRHLKRNPQLFALSAFLLLMSIGIIQLLLRFELISFAQRPHYEASNQFQRGSLYAMACFAGAAASLVWLMRARRQKVLDDNP